MSLSASALDRPAANSLWVAERAGAIWLSSSDGSVQTEISGFTNVRAVALDVRRETVWLLGDRELAVFDLSGERRFSLPVDVPQNGHADLVVVPESGAVWLGVGKKLLSFGPGGQRLGSFDLVANTIALAVEPRGSLLWVGTDRAVEARDLVTGATVGAVDLTPSERLTDLRVQPESGRVWAAVGDQARLYDSSGDLLRQTDLDNLAKIAPAPGNTAWIASRKELVRVSDDGDLGKPFQPLDGKATIQHMTVSGEGTLWVASQTTIARVSSDGTVIDRISFKPPIRIWDLATNTDWIPPTLEMHAPEEGACVASSQPSLDLIGSDVGWGVDPTTFQIFVDGIVSAASCTTAPGSATCQVSDPLTDGEHVLGATVGDHAGNESGVIERRIVVDTVPPEVSITDPIDGAVVAEPEVMITGALSEPAELTVDGAPVPISDDLSFAHGPVELLEGPNELEVVATDCAGNIGRLTLTIDHRPDSTGSLPPDPSTVAPAPDPTLPVEIYEATRFLYDGPTPIQLEVEPGAIDPERIAVIRGSVVNRDGEPLPGVRIGVHGHPELGQTLSRQDGAFDLVVNGGAAVQLTFTKTGYLPTHRPVSTRLRDFAVAEEVVLLPYDERSTLVEMGAPEVQVARGAPSTDQDGTRQATVIVPPGTQAELVRADGSRQSVESLTVRATEYTVGPRGPEAMPAPLPPTSGYTYALELSADEAVVAGATSVTFSAPVIHYVENFLDFPVGGIVPAGYYDREQGVWIPSENGRIVEILDVVSGRAVLDLDGEGQSASEAQLAELGVTEGELDRLGELYSPGQSLWRTPIPHFTPWDCNWPYGPPEDAEEPPEPDADKPDPDDEESDETQDDDEPAEDEDDPACEQGSVIECENQVLGEEIPLVGTSQSLHYRSNRVPGRRVANTMKVRLSGRSVPTSLERIELRIDIAGRRIHRVFAPGPNRTYTFTWDGRDVYGRQIRGRQEATAHVGYVYDAVYYEPAQLASSFAAVSSGTTVIGNRSELEITLWRNTRKMLGIGDATMVDLGGWTLSDHHLYYASSGAKELYRGDGGTRFGGELAAVGSVWRAADHALIDRPILGPRGLAAAPDGGFYYVDQIPQGIAAPFFRVLKADPDGQVESGVYGTQRLDTPQVVVGPTGDVHVATCDYWVWGRIWNLRTGEMWSSFGTGCFDNFVVAPDGSFYFGRDEVFQRRRDGTTTKIFTPPGAGPVGALAIDAQGRLYASLQLENQVWRIDPDGSSRIVAGSGEQGFSGDGGPATAARMDRPYDLAVAPDGSLLILDLGNRRVRRVSRSGTIHTVIGSGERTQITEPTSPLATGLRFPLLLDVTSDGRILVGDSPGQTGEILQLRHLYPRFSPISETAILSEDGTEVFAFDYRGRHLRTHDALTGTVERTLAYDGEGRLASVTDAFGNETHIERDAAGAPTAIVGPFGDRTELTLDDQGFLASVTNPAGESHGLEYAAGGLLASLTDPEGFEKIYDYSPLGRLIQVRDAVGGSKSIRRWVLGAGQYRVTVATAEGRETSYSLRRALDGALVRATNTSGGTTVRTTELRDGSRLVELPSGASVRTVEGADPRFGLQSPLVTSRRVTTPAGLSMEASSRQEASLTSSTDPFSLSSLRESWTVNGREGLELFDATTGEVTTTSPMGRTTVTVLDEHSRPRESRSPGIEPIRYQYDARGRLARVAQGAGEAERVLSLSYGSQGRLSSTNDPLGREVRFDYDAASRLVRQTRPDGRDILFDYDAKGNLTSITPPGQPPHLFRYTPVDAVEEYAPPELDFGSPATTYDYDRDRNLVHVTRPDGEMLDITYDQAGRVDTLSHPDGTTDFTYDTDSGRVVEVDVEDTTVSYAYDGFLSTATTWSGPVQGTVGRAYDDNFWLRSRSVEGDSVSFDYDDDGLLTRAGALTVSRDSATGRITGTTVGAINMAAGYNAFGEIATLEASAADAPLYSVSFERDRLGRIATKTESIGGLVHHYEYDYDSTGRLERVTRDGTVVEEYRYDDNGNRLVATYPWGELAGTYDDQDRLLTYGDSSYTYTAAGELTSRTESGATTQYDYDVFGNLRRVELPGGDIVEYVVDGRNRRVGRKVNGTLVQGFLYKDALNPVAELDGTGAVVSRFVYGTRANVPDYMVKEGATYRLISDHLGSVRLVVDVETGAIAQRLDYDAFGRTTLDTNPGFQPFGFAGGIQDPLTGLVRFGARDYDPMVGRWTSKDPILFFGGDSNTFGYVFNDPVNGADPNGLAQRCSRPLDSAVGRALGELYPGPGSSDKLDEGNREPLHEHLWFDDGENYGYFGPTDDDPGGVRPDRSFPREDYSCRGRQYDEDTLREAISNVEPEDYKLLGDGQYNCQDWVSEVLSEYERLRDAKTRATGVDPETEFVWQKILSRD